MKKLFKNICIASDHAGFELKEKIKDYLISKNIPVIDLGAYSELSVDYPDFAVGLKLPATPLIVKETMIPKSTTLSTTPKITLSPFEFGAHLLPKGATFEF